MDFIGPNGAEVASCPAFWLGPDEHQELRLNHQKLVSRPGPGGSLASLFLSRFPDSLVVY